MNKINDILENLGSKVNISKIYDSRKLNTNKKNNNSTNDIIKNLDNIYLGGKKDPSIYKFNTLNFDSLLKDKRLKDIDLLQNSSFLQKLMLLFKLKLSLTGNPISVFNKKIFFSKNFFKITGIILIIIISLGLIDKILIEDKINSGYTKIISLKENIGDIKLLKKEINIANSNFNIANFLYKPFLLIPNKNIQNGYYLIQGGKYLTLFLNKAINTYTMADIFINKSGGIQDIKITNLLVNVKQDFIQLTNLLYTTIITYDNIDNLNNENLNENLNYAKNKLKGIYSLLNIFNKDFEIFLNLLGHTKEKKYLILFQNNDEIRPTGGFIGSLAYITIKDGKITNILNDDIYAYEWEINKIFKDKEVAPEGLNKITKTFGLRDANYYIDFEKSSNSIKFFLDKINKDIDGIIYINQNTILDFLKLTGGVKFTKLGEKITEENFSLIISTLVEAKSFKVGTLGTPKKILFDFSNEFLNILKKESNYSAYLDVIQKNIQSRDLVIYSFNAEENNLLWKLGLNGKINYSNTLDFTYPVYTNIGGNKSDRYIDLKYKKEIIKNNDCSINTNLNIYRTHQFSKTEEKKVNKILNKYPVKDKTKKDIINIQGKGTNKVYTRILLPKNTIIEKRKGMSIKKTKNVTILGFYINTRILESTNYNINYKIPNKGCENYSYKLYKQPGIRDYSIEIIENNKTIKRENIKQDFIY